MSKDIISKDKCSVCYKLGKSCCHTQPIFSNSELAKVYYETNVFVDMNIKIIPIGGNNFITTLMEWHEDDASKFDIDSRECLFLKDGECSIYEYRPTVCKEYGETDKLPCYAKEFSIAELESMEPSVLDSYVTKANTKIQSYKLDLLNSEQLLNGVFNTKLKNYQDVMSKKDENDIKLNMVLYYIMHNLEYVDYNNIYNGVLKMDYKYELVTVSRGNSIKTINSIRNNILTSKNKHYSKLTYVHKKIHKYLMTKPYSYHKLLVDNINNLFNHLESKPLSKELSDKLHYNKEEDRKDLINLIVTLLSIYALLSNDKLNKYIKNYLSSINDLKLLRLMIYTNIKTLVHGEDNNIFIKDNEFIDLDNISLFSLKLNTDVEKELQSHLEAIVEDRVSLLLKNIKG